MPDHVRSHLLFRSALVTVSDSVCRPHCSQCGGEERAATHGLVFPRRGVFVLQLSARRQIVAEPTRVLFFNRQQSYRVAHPVAGGDDCTALSFEKHALANYIRGTIQQSGTAPIGIFRWRRPSAAIRSSWGLHRLRASLQTLGSPEPLAVEEACAALLAESVANARCPSGTRPRRSVTRRAHRELVAATQIVLARRWREKLTLDQLARAVFSSPFHLARVFRRETGLGLHQYQTNLRLRHALERLAEDVTADLTMLALELGFSSHAHFTAAFRRAFQVAPSRSRKKAVACLGRTR